MKILENYWKGCDKIQDGTADRKKLGTFKRNQYLNTFFDNLAEEAAAEAVRTTETLAAAERALEAVSESPKAHVAQDAQTIKRHLIEDFRTAVSQAKDFIESTNFVPLGMSLMPVVSATDDSERPYQLSLTAIDPDHLMATSGDAKIPQDGSIYSGDGSSVMELRTEMASNLQKLLDLAENI